MATHSVTTNASYLANRLSINERFSKRDLNEWIKSFVTMKEGERVLDVCCGTGKQLLMYLEMIGITGEAHGFDASAEALDRLRKLVPPNSGNVVVHEGYMEDIPRLLVDRRGYFDWVTCGYGLYYSKDAEKTIADLKALLKPAGRLVVVGPARRNNQEFYELVSRVLTIPEFVIFSSTVFMDDVAIPTCRRLFKYVETHDFQNEIAYPNGESIVSYWKSCGTYYDASALPKFTELLEQHFQRYADFRVTKEAVGIISSDTR